MLKHLASVYGHALAAHNNTPLWVRFRERLSGRRKWYLAAAALLVSLIPMRLTAVAPAEIAAAEPFIVAAPMQGVVDRILVKPNEKVKKGTPLLQMVDVELKSTLEVAKRAFRIAEAELLRARQLAFSSRDDKAQLAELTAQVELKRAEMDFAQDQLSRATITAPNGGLIILDDPRKWQGRPVAAGEQVLKLAQPEFIDVEVMVPVTDAVTVSEGNRVDIFLDINPLKTISRDGNAGALPIKLKCCWRFSVCCSRQVGNWSRNATHWITRNSTCLWPAYYNVLFPLSSPNYAMRQLIGV